MRAEEMRERRSGEKREHVSVYSQENTPNSPAKQTNTNETQEVRELKRNLYPKYKNLLGRKEISETQML